ncbi:MAG: sigma-70 family RNA polymerase sigma factor [Acidobacteria bacterium]|nr:sigma-70 family RNA polymerase sigma factor [Acidobacteriota bacterium]
MAQRAEGQITEATGLEAALVARAKSGDLDAFEALVSGYHRRLYRTLLVVCGNAEDAEDVMQTALLKAFQHLHTFEGASRFSTWLTRIAINEALQLRRRRRPTESLDETHPSALVRTGQVTRWAEGPEAQYSAAERRRLVGEAIATLPEHYRDAVVLRDMQGLTAAEAAAMLGIQVANLKTRLHRGRLMLRERLEPVFGRGAGGRGRV